MTNALGNNQIVVYHRAADGTLNPTTPIQTIATGGGGSGLQLSAPDSLGSQGSVQLDAGHHLLFAVNTESAAANNGVGPYNEDCNVGTITSFLVLSDGTLVFADRVSSGGLFPNSLSVTAGPGNVDLLYVLNAGGPGTCGIGPNITGFRVNRVGKMLPVVGSQQPIDPGPATGSGVNCPPTGFSPSADFLCGLNPPSFPRSPAQVQFSPAGDQLVVTVKGTNTIYVFPIGPNGRAGNPTITHAPGPALPTDFAVAFDKHGHLLLTEPFGSATTIPTGGAGALSSFTVNNAGDAVSISSHVGDGGTAACWIALEPNKVEYAYVSNNLSGSISSYSLGTDGNVTLLAGIAATASGPNDLATAREAGASFLYVLEAGNGTIGAFQINLSDGSLTPLPMGIGMPAIAATGIAAY
jgi:6-phosphogluconolactonase (cycloisomerase 2 family)